MRVCARVSSESTSKSDPVGTQERFACTSGGSIAWMLTCSALVLFMTPGLAFFYGGLVRSKNIISYQRNLVKNQP